MGCREVHTHRPRRSRRFLACMYIRFYLGIFLHWRKRRARLWIDRSMKSATKISRNFFSFSCFVLFFFFDISHCQYHHIWKLLEFHYLCWGVARELLFLINVIGLSFQPLSRNPLLNFIKRKSLESKLIVLFFYVLFLHVRSVRFVLVCTYTSYMYKYAYMYIHTYNFTPKEKGAIRNPNIIHYSTSNSWIWGREKRRKVKQNLSITLEKEK